MFTSSHRGSTSSQRTLNRAAYNRAMLNQNMAGYPQARRSSQPPKRHHGFKLWLIVAVLLVGSGYTTWSKHASAEASAARQAQVQAAAAAKQKADIFGGQVQSLIADNPADSLSIAVASNNQAVTTYGSSDTFDGASTAKLLTAADYFHHVEQGTASLQHRIDGQTAQHWLQIMLVNSDDTAWAELNDYLTHDDLANYADSIGFTNYDPDTNNFTARDVASLLQQLYSGKLLNPAHRSQMLNYLSRANYRQFIVAAVPAGDSVYHKVGWDDDTINDGALITHGPKYLVLVIFSDGNQTYDTASRTQLMHAITKDAIAAYL